MTELEFNFNTAIDFSSAVTDHVFALHCLPIEDQRQKITSFQITLEPQCNYALRRDGFGCWQVSGSILSPHNRFVYTAHGIARVDHSGPDHSFHPVFSHQTPLTRPDEAIYQLWKDIPLTGKSPEQKAERLNLAVSEAIRYRPGETDNATTAAESLSKGAGVCQDYTHILLSVARLSGFAARYCMGLIPGIGATHAWAEIAMPSGWIGFDPTRKCVVGEDYLRFAVGRDAADCRVESGVMRGTAVQTLKSQMELKIR